MKYNKINAYETLISKHNFTDSKFIKKNNEYDEIMKNYIDNLEFKTEKEHSITSKLSIIG